MTGTLNRLYTASSLVKHLCNVRLSPHVNRANTVFRIDRKREVALMTLMMPYLQKTEYF